MRKVWQTHRKGTSGIYVEWYDTSNRRRSKYFAPKFKNLIQPFMARKFAELNADCRQPGEIIRVIWDDFIKEYLDSKEIQGLAAASLASINLTLAQFKEVVNPFSTEQINQNSITMFIKARLKKVAPHTVNKDIRNLRALFSYGKQRFYITSDLHISKVKADQKPIRILSNKEVKNLVTACGDNKQWRMKILLAVCTGLRRSDIEHLQLNNIDIERKTISLVNRKTGKATNFQPLPDKIVPELTRFILEEIAEGQVNFFKTKFSKRWYTIKKRAGLEDINFHDLRRTFGSMQASAGVPIKALQEMYNHSSIDTTMKHYIKTDDAEKRKGVNALKVEDWLGN